MTVDFLRRQNSTTLGKTWNCTRGMQVPQASPVDGAASLCTPGLLPSLQMCLTSSLPFPAKWLGFCSAQQSNRSSSICSVTAASFWSSFLDTPIFYYWCNSFWWGSSDHCSFAICVSVFFREMSALDLWLIFKTVLLVYILLIIKHVNFRYWSLIWHVLHQYHHQCLPY